MLRQRFMRDSKENVPRSRRFAADPEYWRFRHEMNMVRFGAEFWDGAGNGRNNRIYVVRLCGVSASRRHGLIC